MSKEKVVINATCACKDDNGIWFVHWMLPILFYFDCYSKRIVLSRVIPVKDEVGARNFSSIVKVKTKLYIIAGAQRQSYIYDMHTDSFEEMKNIGGDPGSHYGAYLINDYLYVMPLRGNNPLRINLSNFEVQTGANWNNLYKDYLNCYLQSIHAIDKTGNIYIPVSNTNTYAIYNTRENEWTRVDVAKKDVNCTGITINKKGIYIFDKNSSSILKIDENGKILANCYIKSGLVMIYSIEDIVLADSISADNILIFDDNLNVINVVEKESIESKLNGDGKHGFWLEFGNKLCGILKNNKIFFISNDGSVETFSVSISIDEWEAIKKECLHNATLHYENSWLRLEDLIIKL